ncbi:MAG: phosphoesterase, partial [Flavobacteriaceae bacterium]|nr:phosphoesterase [Flavobacteriaceae bacterium]
EYYSQPVSVPVIDLDTLMGGMTVLRKGGGHQSISLRLKSKDGRQFVMRALEKSAEAYLQAMVAKEEFIIGKVKGTAPERVLKDFYTGSHPYAPFVVGALADVLDIYHTNPLLCYIPKQPRLGRFNEEFGDKLFMIEERVTSGHGNQASFGFADTIIGTDDLIARMASDEKYEVDQERYVRARLFDMLLGDWDRHDDQWRWAKFKEKDKVIYRPIPRDRDQVFSIMGDGFLMGVATRAVPGLRLMEGFQKEIRSVEGFNSSPKTFALDMLLLPETTEAQWLTQAKAIQDGIDEAAIDAAFEAFPKEIQNDSKTKWIKEVLLARKQGLLETAKAYYNIINKISVVIGTDKDDHFRIEDLGEGRTEVSGYRIIKGKLGTRFFNKTYDRNTTKEVWIYGLDDKDVFELTGKGKRGPKIRLVGGLNNDTYQLAKRGQVFVYDYKSQKNTFDTPHGKKRLTDHYDTNTYNPYQVKENQNFFLPFVGFNPDDGLQLLATNTFTHNGFIKEPFSSKHRISAGFYFA